MSASCFYRKDYFMTADDQQAAKAARILQYAVLRERQALLRCQINDIANALERGAKVLKSRPETFGFDGEDAPLGDYRNLKTLLEDFKQTQIEVQDSYK